MELRLTPTDRPRIIQDFWISVESGASGASGASVASGASGSGGSGEILVSSASGGSGGSGGSGDIVLISGTSKELHISGESSQSLISDSLLISGDLLGSGDFMGSAISGSSADFASGGSGISTELHLGSGGSGDQSGFEVSGDLLSSGVSGISGVSGDFESGDQRITFISGG